jgi:hypothetical protein
VKYQDSAKKWNDWAAANVPKHNDLIKNFDELKVKHQELEEKWKIAEVAAAKAGDGMPVDTTELLKRVDEVISARGYVNKAEMQKIYDEEAKKMINETVTAQASQMRDNFYKTDIPNFMSFMTTMNDLQFRHRDEFKENLDPKAFSKFMVDEKIEDPAKAYERFTSEKRSANEKVKMEAEIRDKVEKDWASKHNLPGSGASPSPELGPVQLARMNKISHIPANAEAGDSHELAYAAAAELRAEGKI